MIDQGVPATVGVVGGGRMGSGIAHAFLCTGSDVVLVDVDAAAAARSVEVVAGLVKKSAARGTLPPGADIPDVLARLQAADTAQAAATADLVVEAVPESFALKRDVLATLASLLSPDAVIATNTSSISIDSLADAVAAPGRFIGMHFFNPVPASGLVEIVTGSATSPEVVAAVQAWVRALGKTPVTVTDSPGFASSRLGVLLGLEAIRMLEAGVASAEDIDAAMVLGYRHPVGPLRLTDIVGLDVRLGVAEYLAETLGERFRAPQLLREKVAAGELGQKSGRGFYDWPS